MLIKRIVFVISLIVLLFSLYEVLTIGWIADLKFLFWSVVGGISFVIALATYKSIL